MTKHDQLGGETVPAGVAIDLDLQRDHILDSINEGVFTVDLDWRITSFNQAAERITGIARQDAIGQRCREVFRANICEASCALRQTLQTTRPVVNATVYVIDARGARIPIKISAAALHDDRGQVIGGVETFQDLRQVEALKKRLRGRYSFADIVGRSAAISQLFDLLPQVADSESTVLIDGPSGTGKELFARALHHLSPRRKKPFVAVNCGALPDTLLESELFGHMAGAFTDAKRDKPGRFVQADGGTLLLDEIGDISPAMQVRLLRVLQERQVDPLGALEPIRVDVRVLAATNRDLAALVRAGDFREDLYYRIHVIHLSIPALRERREDVPLLLDHFIDHYNNLYGREVAGLSARAFSLLSGYDFPGNVRELQNILEHAFVLCQGGEIDLEHLPPHLLREVGDPVDPGAGLNLKRMERLLIEEALRKHAGNRTLAAAELGIDPSTLYRKIRQEDIAVPPQDGRNRRSTPVTEDEDR